MVLPPAIYSYTRLIPYMDPGSLDRSTYLAEYTLLHTLKIRLIKKIVFVGLLVINTLKVLKIDAFIKMEQSWVNFQEHGFVRFSFDSILAELAMFSYIRLFFFAKLLMRAWIFSGSQD